MDNNIDENEKSEEVEDLTPKDLEETDQKQDDKKTEENSDDSKEESKSNSRLDSFLTEKTTFLGIPMPRKLKIKIYLAIAGAATFAFVILFVYTALRMISIDGIFQNLKDMGSKVMDGIDYQIDLIYDGMAKNNDYIKNLQKNYDEFEEKNYLDGHLDVALIAATVNYATNFDPLIWKNTEEVSEEEINDALVENEFTPTGFSTVDPRSNNAFLTWAGIWVGDFNSWNLMYRGLSGALVTHKAKAECVTESPSQNIYNTLLSLLGTISFKPDDIIDLVNPTPLIASSLANKYTTGGNTLQEFYESAFKEAKYGYEDFFDYSGIEGVDCSDKVDSETGEQMHRKITFTFRNDYEKYRSYLREFFIPTMYLDCKNCTYKDREWKEGEKEKKIESIIDEIFEERDYYLKLLGYDETNSSFFSGLHTTGIINGNFEGALVPLGEPLSSNPNYDGSLVGSILLGQCVWYARGRAKEIINGLTMDESIRSRAISALNAVHGNGVDWWNNPALSVFGSSTNVAEPKPGAIAVWGFGPGLIEDYGGNYGHVAIVEAVNPDGTIKISEGWRKRPWNADEGWNGVVVNTRVVPVSWMQNYGGGYYFRGYVYLLN